MMAPESCTAASESENKVSTMKLEPVYFGWAVDRTFAKDCSVGENPKWSVEHKGGGKERARGRAR